MPMKKYQVREVQIPTHSLLWQSLRPIDYSDAFAIDLKNRTACTSDSLFKDLLRSTPKWVSSMMNFRDKTVELAGLKTSTDKNKRALQPDSPPLKVGDKIGIFRIYQVTTNEIVFGENDHHLDFRVSIFCVSEENTRSVTVSTVVKFNNALGRIYFSLVCPFHKAVVTAMLEKLTISN